LVIVTHDDMISKACKRVVHIHEGRIVEGAGSFGVRAHAGAATPARAERPSEDNHDDESAARDSQKAELSA
jgi:ABC-type lipoprotein export system ATPase subunit